MVVWAQGRRKTHVLLTEDLYLCSRVSLDKQAWNVVEFSKHLFPFPVILIFFE